MFWCTGRTCQNRIRGTEQQGGLVRKIQYTTHKTFFCNTQKCLTDRAAGTKISVFRLLRVPPAPTRRGFLSGARGKAPTRFYASGHRQPVEKPVEPVDLFLFPVREGKHKREKSAALRRWPFKVVVRLEDDAV